MKTFVCQFCGCNARKDNNLSLKAHERYCLLNPNKDVSLFCSPEFKELNLGHDNGYTRARKLGLPKPSNNPQKCVETKRQNGTLFHSEETKHKISIARKKYLENNPNMVPYLLNHSSKISYPEHYFRDCFSGIASIEFQYPVFRYKLDFANLETKRYFEVDGEQHYVDTKIVKHDVERTEKLIELGWTGIRLRWAHFKKSTIEEQHQQVQNIINFLI